MAGSLVAAEVSDMGKTDPRVDQYITKSADFAKPILTHLRRVVHTACPEVEETMKWSFPHFDYKKEMLCSMAAFKGHCAFGFWKSSLVLDGPASGDAMGHFGRITSVRDLPSDRELAAYVKKAAKLNDEGVKVAKKPAPKKPLGVPADFAAALKKRPAARKAFDAFSPSHRREYVEWVTEAKTDATRQKRMKTAIDWLSEGKSRNWKYEPK
jgi:uncharacterized protein YdeI (YjbR/CyaY-like superfamily)